MPGFNGTGPNGMGPMTGGGRGFCISRGTAQRGFGYGMRPRGRRFSGSWGRRGFFPANVPEPAYDDRRELDVLREQADLLQRDMADINRRIEELEKK